MRIDGAIGQFVIHVKRTFGRDFREPRRLTPVPARAVGECGTVDAVVAQSLNIDVGYNAVVIGVPAVVCHKQASLFGHNGLAGEHNIGRRLSPARRRIDITGFATRRLLADESERRSMLADKLVGRREIEDHLGSGHGQRAGGRHSDPQVLADLHADINSMGQYYRLVFIVGRRSKPSALVEFIIIRYISLADYRRHAFGYVGGTIEYCALRRHRQADDQINSLIASEILDTTQAGQRFLQQKLCVEQIAACITRDAQLREHHHLYTLGVKLRGIADNDIDICIDISHSDMRRHGRNSEKSVGHIYLCILLAR